MITEKLAQQMKDLRAIFFDFDGVFTTNQVIVDQNGKESVLCSRSDGLGMRLLSAEKIQAFILSTETNPVVAARAKKLKLRCISGCLNKGNALREMAQELGIPLTQVAFVGNDANDLEALEICGIGVAVGDAYPEAKQAADLVLQRNGGHGAVREFCELLVRVRRSLQAEQSPWLCEDLRSTYA